MTYSKVFIIMVVFAVTTATYAAVCLLFFTSDDKQVADAKNGSKEASKNPAPLFELAKVKSKSEEINNLPRFEMKLPRDLLSAMNKGENQETSNTEASNGAAVE